MCVALAPEVMLLDAAGKARALGDVEWSPADGDFIHQCPVNALSTQTVATTRGGRRSSSEQPHVKPNGATLANPAAAGSRRAWTGSPVWRPVITDPGKRRGDHVPHSTRFFGTMKWQNVEKRR